MEFQSLEITNCDILFAIIIPELSRGYGFESQFVIGTEMNLKAAADPRLFRFFIFPYYSRIRKIQNLHSRCNFRQVFIAICNFRQGYIASAVIFGAKIDKITDFSANLWYYKRQNEAPSNKT